MCHIFDAIRHFNNVIKDLSWDMWHYICLEYFKLKVVADEVGSSTMPHKVNPISFENAKANVGISNAIFVELSDELPVCLMQRDLSDSSTQRNIGSAFGYSLIALNSVCAGLGRIDVHNQKLKEDLDKNWEVLAEAYQTLLRRLGYSDAYDMLKKLTRGKRITKELLEQFVDSLEISDQDKEKLLSLSPDKYVGEAANLAKNCYGMWQQKMGKI